MALSELSAMDPESYPPQKSEVTYSVSSIYVSPQGPISIDVPGTQPEVIEEPVNSVEPTDPAELPQEEGELGWGEEQPTESADDVENVEGTDESGSPEVEEETETEGEQ